jgi:hypothetical protein
MEDFAEIVRLTPQVLLPLSVAFIFYFLVEAVWAIGRWLFRKGRARKDPSALFRAAVIFFLTLGIEVFLMFGAMNMGKDPERALSALLRQALYLVVLYVPVVFVIFWKFRKTNSTS